MATAPKAPICTICGVKLGHTSLESEDITPGWYSKISAQGSVLLSGPHWPYYGHGPISLIPDSTVVRHAADLTDPPPKMRILSTDESLFPQEEMDVIEADRRYPSASQILYVGIHRSCEDMANRAMRSSPVCEIRSLGDLWMTLERRCTRTIQSRRLTLSFLPIILKNRTWQGLELGLERYFIPPEFFDQSEENCPVAEQEWWEADPISIPGLTVDLMCNLRPALQTSPFPRFTRHFTALPQEIRDNIMSFLLVESVALDCNYLAPQSYWKQLFLNIPFLWDLDLTVIDRKPSPIEKGVGWDWERLTRQVLAPVRVAFMEEGKNAHTAWDYHQVGLVVPPGLKNRRRIWQILEEMFPDDVEMYHSKDDPNHHLSRIIITMSVYDHDGLAALAAIASQAHARIDSFARQYLELHPN
ncbi:COesterase domain-containing protein [Fusarium sp. Ph1]|nr:COesterase domain-containing protein [Fusarium sp. Ph1]